MKEMSHNNIFYAIDSLEINNKIDAYYELSLFNANRRMWHLEREAGAKNSDLWSLWVSIDWAWKEESNELPECNLSPFFR